MKFFLVLSLFLFSTLSFSQDLLKERIRKLTNKKTSIYVESGIFHNGATKGEGLIKGVRDSYTAKQGFERVVVDFGSNDLPRIYGNLNAEDKTLYIDFFDTKLDKELKTIAKTKNIEKINFFPIDSAQLSMEIKLKSKTTADIFFLENPGRLVIDLKN